MKTTRFPVWLARWAAPALLATGLAFSFGLAWLVQSGQEERAGKNVSVLTEQIGREIRGDIAAYGTVLRGLHGLFISSRHVDRNEFRRYVDLLRLQHDAALLQGFVFVEREGNAFVVKYVEPLAGNEALPGRDIAERPAARDALARVMAGGSLILSAPFRMEQGSPGDTGLILLLPLYESGDPARPYATTGRKTAALVGVTINLEKSLRNITGPLTQRHVFLKLTELERAWGAGEAEGQPFFDSARGAAVAAPAWLSASRELEVLGNRWRLGLAAEPASIPPATRFAPQMALALGLTLTLLLFLLVRNLGRIGTLAAAKAERMTKELRQSEEMFRDLAELSSDWFWEQDADFRYKAASGEVESKGKFRVGDMLGKTRWELPIVGVSEEEWARHRAQLERHEPFRNFTYQIRAADDRLHWYAVSGKPVFEASGRFAGYRGTGHDLSRAKEAEQALRDSETRLALALESAEAGLWDFDPVARTSYFSPRFGELLGYPDAQSLKEAFFLSEALHPEDRERVLAAQERALSEGTRFDETYRLRRQDGTYRWFRGIGHVYRDEMRQAVRYPGLLIDVTAQRQVEQALRESEEKLRGLFELSPVGIALTDMDGRYVQFNEAFRTICGYSADELKRLDYWTLTPEKYRPDEMRQLESLQRTGHYGPYEKEYRRKDGSLVPLNLNGLLLTGADGRSYIWSIVEDITERKRAERQLRLAATVFEHSLEGVTITDGDGNILSVNRAFSEITGYGPEEVVGRNPRLLQSGRHGPDFYRAMWDSIREKGHWRGEIWNRRKNGEIYPELLGICAVPGPDGRPEHYIGMFTDIGELKRAEEAMRRFNAELEQRVAERTAALTASNKELEAFSYSVSHDLRAPLRAINGFSRILAEDYADRLDEAAQGHLARIRAASVRMAEVMDDMLELARITRIEPRREDVDLSELARSVAAELPEDGMRRIELVIAPDLHASADPGLMHIVLQNLLHNAWKFTGPTEAARIEFGVEERGGERVFFVRDNGAGFDPAHAKNLFGAFQRLHRSDEFPGTGIGLATAQRIVQRHGGRIWAEGAVDRGATFWFTLPAV